MKNAIKLISQKDSLYYGFFSCSSQCWCVYQVASDSSYQRVHKRIGKIPIRLLIMTDLTQFNAFSNLYYANRLVYVHYCSSIEQIIFSRSLSTFFCISGQMTILIHCFDSKSVDKNGHLPGF